MDKLTLRKNRLDLEYHGESQKVNAILILLTTGILAFIGNFIFLRDNQLFYFGAFFTSIIFIISLITYKKKIRRMNNILNEVENLK